MPPPSPMGGCMDMAPSPPPRGRVYRGLRPHRLWLGSTGRKATVNKNKMISMGGQIIWTLSAPLRYRGGPDMTRGSQTVSAYAGGLLYDIAPPPGRMVPSRVCCTASSGWVLSHLRRSLGPAMQQGRILLMHTLTHISTNKAFYTWDPKNAKPLYT